MYLVFIDVHKQVYFLTVRLKKKSVCSLYCAIQTAEWFAGSAFQIWTLDTYEYFVAYNLAIHLDLSWGSSNSRWAFV